MFNPPSGGTLWGYELKHRKIIFVLLRTHVQTPPVVLDSFYSLEEAENQAGVYAQQMLEHGLDGFSFSVQSSCYYDV